MDIIGNLFFYGELVAAIVLLTAMIAGKIMQYRIAHNINQIGKQFQNDPRLWSARKEV